MKTSKFKMTEVGPIPEEWEVKRLGEVGEPLMCKRILKSQTSDSGDIPFYKIGTFGKTADAFISRELFASFKRQYSYPHYGDVLISAAGTIGRTVVFDGHDAYFQDSNIVWIGHDEHVVLNKYLKWYLDIIKWQTENGGIVTRLYNDNLRNSLIVVPPLPEQEKIADALSDVDALLSTMSTLIEKNRNIKTGAMQELLGMRNAECGMRNVPRRRLAGFSGEWVKKRLGECVEVLDNRRIPLNDSQRKNGPYPYCGANGVVDYIDCYSFDEDVILIAEDGGNFSDYATRPIAYQMHGKFWVNNHAHVLVAKAGYSQEYIFSQLQHKDITDVISGGTRAKLTRRQLENLNIVIPPTLAEQQAIAAVLSDMDAEIAALEAKRAKDESIKQGMMQELLTGKTRLL